MNQVTGDIYLDTHRVSPSACFRSSNSRISSSRLDRACFISTSPVIARVEDGETEKELQDGVNRTLTFGELMS